MFLMLISWFEMVPALVQDSTGQAISYLEILIQDHYSLIEFFLELSTLVCGRMIRMVTVTYNVGNDAREKEALLMLMRALLLEINEKAKLLYDTKVEYAPWFRFL